jgi:hypothetical protein
MPVTITLRIGTAVTNSASARERAWRGRCRRRTIAFRACARAHAPLHRRASASISRRRGPLPLFTDLAIYGCVINGSGYAWIRPSKQAIDSSISICAGLFGPIDWYPSHPPTPMRFP